MQRACLPVAQSGLPHQQAAAALSLLQQTTPTWLACPGLPQRSTYEQPTIQSLVGFPGLHVTANEQRVHIERNHAEQHLNQLGLAYLQGDLSVGQLNTDHAAGLYELLRNSHYTHATQSVVSYIVGPISLGLYLTDEYQRPLLHDPVLREALAQHLALRLGWLTRRLSELAASRVALVYEPLLAAVNSPFAPITWDEALELLEMVFAGTRASCGILLSDFGGWQHDTNPAAGWLPLLETSADLIGLDVYQHRAVLNSMLAGLPAFLERGGTLIWGLVPSDATDMQTETPATLVQHFQQIMRTLAAANIPTEQVVQASLISTTSGLDHLPVPLAEHALHQCAAVSALLREHYGLTDTAAITPGLPDDNA
jgi:hypothetical protein